MSRFVALLLACMFLVAPHLAQGAISCGTVSSALSPCVPYAQGKTQTPGSGCCSGIRRINNAASTTADRQAACQCLKSLSSSIGGLNQGRVSGLPGMCGVSVPYTISPSTDCNKVK